MVRQQPLFSKSRAAWHLYFSFDRAPQIGTGGLAGGLAHRYFVFFFLRAVQVSNVVRKKQSDPSMGRNRIVTNSEGRCKFYWEGMFRTICNLCESRILRPTEIDFGLERWLGRSQQAFVPWGRHFCKIVSPNPPLKKLLMLRCNAFSFVYVIYSTSGAVCSSVVIPGGSSMIRMFRKWISAPSDSRHR